VSYTADSQVDSMRTVQLQHRAVCVQQQYATAAALHHVHSCKASHTHTDRAVSTRNSVTRNMYMLLRAQVWNYKGARPDPRFARMTRSLRSLGAWVRGETSAHDGSCSYRSNSFGSAAEEASNSARVTRLRHRSPAANTHSRPFSSDPFSDAELHSLMGAASVQKPRRLSADDTSGGSGSGSAAVPLAAKQAVFERQLVAMALHVVEYLMQFATNWAMLARALDSSSAANSSAYPTGK
jgi:hypothetical protein